MSSSINSCQQRNIYLIMIISQFEQNGLFLTSKHEIAEALICGDVANGRPGADINAHDSVSKLVTHSRAHNCLFV